VTLRSRAGVPSQAGFTLVEIMVALAVCAIALVAGTKAMQAVTTNAERQANAVLGNLCADNALSDIRITGRYPDVGENTVACPQAGRDLQVRLTVRPTANPSFRRVDAEVFLAGHPVVQEVTIVGRY
jgi:general secretion pathway protein I